MDHPKLEEWKAVWRERRSVTMVYILLRISVVLVMLAQIFNGNFENRFSLRADAYPVHDAQRPGKKAGHHPAEHAGNHHPAVHLCSGNHGRDRRVLRHLSLLGHGAAHAERLLCAAIGFSLLDILNRHSEARFHLSPLYLAIVAFCFSMTVGVIWEFFECTMDQLFFLDMQKDTVVNTIGSIMLDPTGGNTSTVLKNITDVIIVQADGTQTALGLGGYLDIGLLDTMEDLFVNFIGALTFSIIGYFYVCSRGENKFAKRFIPVANNSTRPKDAPSEAPEKNEN